MTPREQERAAVVAWLDELAEDSPPIIDSFISLAARAIERGDHLEKNDAT